MAQSFDVRFQKTYVYVGRRTTTYWVRWSVAGEPFKEPFKTVALSDSFRSSLVTAARQGEGFDTVTGRPLSMGQNDRDMPWYVFACQYVDLKWPDAAATTRRGIAEAMTTATCAMLASTRGKPDGKALRSVLMNWAFNTPQRTNGVLPTVEIRDTLRWVEGNTRNVSVLAEPEHLRAVLNALARKIDGKSLSAATVANRKRAVLFNALEYAVEVKALTRNPLPGLKWTVPKIDHEVDPDVVVNLNQVRTLLHYVTGIKRSGERLKACYACSYYSGLRPEEAIGLTLSNIKWPQQRWNPEKHTWEDDPEDWGWFNLKKAAPHAGRRWTDSGKIRDERGLKRRARTATRLVPIPPELVRILREHLKKFGTDPDGRLFTGEHGGEVPVRLYNEVWRKARQATFTPEVHKSTLAQTPYDLRHACVSTWLASGIEGPRVAKWAGHSVEVLYKVYAKCLHGGETAALQRLSVVMR